jgi:hypothetical protein
VPQIEDVARRDDGVGLERLERMRVGRGRRLDRGRHVVERRAQQGAEPERHEAGEEHGECCFEREPV